MYDDTCEMQYLGERATFSMIARNDEMMMMMIMMMMRNITFFDIARAFLRNSIQNASV